jgi:peptidoglycan/xylan/chitin deacetylase (PgdA/CDA1 family)
MSVSRVRFLKSLGASMAGLAAGSGIASAAQALANKMGPDVASGPVAENAVKAPVPFIGSGSGEGNRIAISFDDGPTPGVTEVVLDELKQRNIRATFFMIGQRLVEAPEPGRRVVAEGHEVGNHTFHHLKLNTLPDRQVDWEIQKAQDTIGEVLNHRPAWLRPPYGAFRQDQAHLPMGKQLGVVLWSVDPRDWSKPGEAKIVDAILTQTKPGSIILCHDLHQQTANCIGRILDGLLARNFEFLTMSDFLGQPAITPAASI